MRILLINSVCGKGSTGRICAEIAADYQRQGHEVKIAYGRETVDEQLAPLAVRIGNQVSTNWHGVLSRLLDAHGLGSYLATKRFLKWADAYNPELLWLHNIHGYYIHYPLLFKWIKSRPSMEVRWTLHDCWAFTGHCSYFTIAGCDKWKTGCSRCPQPRKYPARYLFDGSKRNYKRKQNAFCGVRNLTVITPSEWLANLVRQSFLKDYPVEVRHNKVDTAVFRPTHGTFRQKHHLENKNIILGVACPWDERKGLKDFVKLSSLIGREERIVLVGLDSSQITGLPANILGLTRTDSAGELAEIYTAADIFFNPTYEDNYPSTNIEAIACGTPVVTYCTGGSPESTEAENVVPCGDVNGAWLRMQKILNER